VLGEGETDELTELLEEEILMELETLALELTELRELTADDELDTTEELVEELTEDLADELLEDAAADELEEEVVLESVELDVPKLEEALLEVLEITLEELEALLVEGKADETN
jgi:hypothetical protein